MQDEMSAAAVDPAITEAAASETSAASSETTSVVDLGADIPPMTLDDLIGDTDSLALTKMGFSHLIQHIDVIGMTTLVTMAVMSVLTWFYIFHNAFRIWSVKRRARLLLEDFWEARSPEAAIGRLQAEPEFEPLSKIALDATDAAAHHSDSQGGRMAEALSRHEFIDRSLRQAVSRESSRFEVGLTLLATVGATAPFVGLFGTVWGIYHALIGIGASGKATLDVVAGPVGEALIMTCIGLGVAIPAVLAYNMFVRSNREVVASLNRFAHDLLDYFATGERVKPQQYGSRKTA
jgi:biopolymer transport protein ExbB